MCAFAYILDAEWGQEDTEGCDESPEKCCPSDAKLVGQDPRHRGQGEGGSDLEGPDQRGFGGGVRVVPLLVHVDQSLENLTRRVDDAEHDAVAQKAAEQDCPSLKKTTNK